MFYPVMGKLGRELQWFVSKIFLLSLFWWAFLSMISTRPWMSNWYICSKNKVDKSSNKWFINFSVLQLVPNFSLTTDFDFPILFLPIQKSLTFFFTPMTMFSQKYSCLRSQKFDYHSYHPTKTILADVLCCQIQWTYLRSHWSPVFISDRFIPVIFLVTSFGSSSSKPFKTLELLVIPFVFSLWPLRAISHMSWFKQISSSIHLTLSPRPMF